MENCQKNYKIRLSIQDKRNNSASFVNRITV